jgi:hypothetical protein
MVRLGRYSQAKDWLILVSSFFLHPFYSSISKENYKVAPPSQKKFPRKSITNYKQLAKYKLPLHSPFGEEIFKKSLISFYMEILLS